MRQEKQLKPGISLCMIVKDEVLTIKRAIESVLPIVNEIIVVDTGSRDGTRLKAEACGARIFDYTWNDNFSAPRNYAISLAQYEWILVLDADEVIDNSDLGKIIQAIQENNRDAYYFLQRNYCNDPETEAWQLNKTDYKWGKEYRGYFDISIIRFFRNDPRIYYEGVVHEIVDDSVKNMRKSYFSIPIHHFSHFDDIDKRRKKSYFYLALLQKQLEANPADQKTWFLMGRQYHSLGNHAEAIVFLKNVLDMGSKSEMVYDNLASVYIETGLFEEACRVLETLISLNPRYAEAYSNLGIAYAELGRFDAAVQSFQKAITLNTNAFKPYFNAAATYFRIKDFKRALDYITKAEEIMPNFPRVMYLKYFILSEMHMTQKALEVAKMLQKIDNKLYEKIHDRCRQMELTMTGEQGK